MKCNMKTILVIVFVFFHTMGKGQCDPDQLKDFKDDNAPNETFLKDFSVFITGEENSHVYDMRLGGEKKYRFYFSLSENYNGEGRVTLDKNGTIIYNKVLDKEKVNSFDIICDKAGAYHMTFYKVNGEELCAEAVLVRVGDSDKEDGEGPLYLDTYEKVYEIVDQMPAFNEERGDLNIFRNWVVDNLEYPEEAKAKQAKGRVFVQFIVDKNGYVKDVEIVRGVEPILDSYTKELIESCPKWRKPGLIDGHPVKVSSLFL